MCWRVGEEIVGMGVCSNVEEEGSEMGNVKRALGMPKLKETADADNKDRRTRSGESMTRRESDCELKRKIESGVPKYDGCTIWRANV